MALRGKVTDAAGNVIWTQRLPRRPVPEKLKVAETLQEFRREHLYNRYDGTCSAFRRRCRKSGSGMTTRSSTTGPPARMLDVSRYTESSVNQLVANGDASVSRYAPMRWHSQVEESERVYRHIPYGRDSRRVRARHAQLSRPELSTGSNAGPRDRVSRREQLDVAEAELAHSRATWKIIAADMPLGLRFGTAATPKVARAGKHRQRRWPRARPRNRDRRLLRFIKRDELQRRVADGRRALLRGPLL